MKKKPLSLSMNFIALSVYLDDIKDIYTILDQYEDPVRLSDDRNEYSNLNDLLEHRKRSKLTQLSLGIFTPHIYLDLKKSFLHGSSLHIDSENAEDEGSFLRIKEILYKRKHPLSKILNYYTGFLFLFWLVAINAILYFSIPQLPRWLLILSAGVSFFLTSMSFYFGSGMTTQIWLKNKDNIPNFFVRNKDNLIMIIISAVLCAVVATGLNFLLGGL